MGQTVHQLLVVVISLNCFTCDQYAGPYDVDLQQVVQCDNRGTEDFKFSSTRMTKVSRHSFNYYTNYTFNIPFDDNLSVVTDMQRWGNGGWRSGFLTLDFPHVCTNMKEFVPAWFKIMIENTGYHDCPIPEGNYKAISLNASFALFNDVPTLPYGRYRMINELFKENSLVGCIGFVMDINPKRRSSKRKKN